MYLSQEYLEDLKIETEEAIISFRNGWVIGNSRVQDGHIIRMVETPTGIFKEKIDHFGNMVQFERLTGFGHEFHL